MLTGVFNIFPAKGDTLLTPIKYTDIPLTASDSNAITERENNKFENTFINISPANIIFNIHHEPDNTYILPQPINVANKLINSDSLKSNIHFDISDNLIDKLANTPESFNSLESGKQVNVKVAFIDKDLDFLNKPPIDTGYITILSEDEILGRIHVTYCIDGLYDEHYTNNIDRYSGTKIRIGGSFYKKIGNINFKNTVPPIINISFTPYILDTNDVPNDMGIEINNDSLGRILLNEDGNFEFTDHTFKQSIIGGDKKVTFQIQMKQSVYDDIKQKSQQNPSIYKGNYFILICWRFDDYH